MDYTETLRTYIIDNFLFGDGERLRNEASLLENGIIDSTGILELIFFLENTFGIKVETEELVPENMDSINNLNKFIAMKRTPAPVEAC